MVAVLFIVFLVALYKNRMQISEKYSAGNYYMSKQQKRVANVCFAKGKNSNVVLK